MRFVLLHCYLLRYTKLILWSYLATIAPATPKLSWQEVLPKIEESLGGNHTGVEPRLEYLARPDGSVALTHVIPVSNLDEGLWVEAFANADTGEVMSVVDYSAHATVSRSTH